MEDDRLILGRYRPIAQAGSGGFATVQVAWDTRIQRRVAVKCIELDEALAASGFVPGLDEARTAAMLSDPSIAGVFDFEVADGFAYLIMEYVDGMTLSQLMREHGEDVDVDVVAAVFEAVSCALATAHDNQVLHLDIKPDNILINRQGQVKVADFGLAQLSDAAGFGQARGGTIGYMPPEQMRFEALDARCDEWALASVVYEMVAGENPFRARTLDEAVDVIEQAELVLPSLCMDGLDSEADDVLFAALDPDREERYASVAEFAEELEPCLGDPKRGRRALAAVVNGALDDGDGEGESASEPARSLAQRIPYVRWNAVLRLGAAANACVLGLFALASIPQVVEAFSPAIPLGSLTMGVVGAAFPSAGCALALMLVSAAFLTQGSVVLALVSAAFAVAWWWAFGRFGKEQAVASFVPAASGALGLMSATPLVAGGLLRARYALAASAWAFGLALILASFGTASLVGWGPALSFVSSVPIDLSATPEGRLLALLASPGTWCVLAAWLLAALVASAGASRATTLGVVLGGVASTVVVAAGFVVSFVVEGAAVDAVAMTMVVLSCLLATGLGLFARLRVVAPEGLDDEADASDGAGLVEGREI